jgi:FixJ family two-component response regulator
MMHINSDITERKRADDALHATQAQLAHSGLQLQSELNRQKVSIPVIFITAHPDEQVRERALSEGAVAVLGKPFNDEVLLGAIDSAVGSKGPSAT